MEGSPVLFLIFNRPDLTKRVFARIREARPPKLFVAADGPRSDHPEDAELCARARHLATQVDWDCEMFTLFRDENLGCQAAISSAITWFFENVDAGVILEDDCLPHPTFFRYCAELLDYYRTDQRLMMISGNNPLERWEIEDQSYHFSNFGGIWGWATWRRAWNEFSRSISVASEQVVERVLKSTLVSEVQVAQRKKVILRALKGDLESWGYIWFWARVLNSGLSAVPAVNLVTNIGFNSHSTHTTNPDDPRADLKQDALALPLNHPLGVFPDCQYDARWFKITHPSSKHTTRPNIIRTVARRVGLLPAIRGAQRVVKRVTS